MVSVMGKRKKMPTTLGINSATGIIMIAPEKLRDGPEQTWTAEKMTHYSIEGKHVFLELVRPSKSIDFHAGAKDTAYEIVSVLGELAGAVRAEGLREVIAAGSGQSQRMGKMLYDFMAQGDDEVTVAVDDEVILLDDKTSEEWWKVRRIRNGKEGVVPSSYVEITGTVDSSSSMAGVNAAKSQVEQNRLEEERMAKESLKVAREEDARGSEVGPGVRLPERGSSLMAGDSSNNHGQRRGNAQSDNSNSRSKSSEYFPALGADRSWTLLTRTEPDPKKVRTWTDRSKTFKVEAQFLGLKDGKINLHKTNGIKIAVPVDKMAVEDLEYVERITGESLDEDKPLGSRKRNIGSQSTSASRGNAGATIEHPKVPEYDWFQFFLSCEVAVGLCENYSQTFNRGSMDESVLPDVDSTVLRSMGIREGDIIKIMRYLDKKYGRVGGKRNLDTPDGDSPGGLFSGPGGALRNNTRKGRPAPAVQTNDVVDPKAFSQDTPKSEAPKSAAHDGVPTPLATAPVPEKKDVVRAGFDDDAWSVKPAASQPPQTATPATTAPAPAPSQPALTGSMQELTLLTQPLQPTKVAPPPQPVVTKPPEQQGPPPVTPSIFQGIGNQQTGLPAPQQNIARQRPAPPPFQNQGGLIPPAPSRPLSAPHANQPSGFPLPPLQAQSTGIQSSSGFQQIAPPGQSLDELRLRQQYAAMNPPQNMNMNMGLMPQPTGFQYNGLQQPNQQQPNQQQPNGFQYPMQTGMPQQISPMQQPPMNQLPFQQQQPQPTGFQNQSPFGQQAPPQFPQPTGVNAFLQPALQPTPTGIQQNPGFASTFTPPPVPPMPPQLPVPAPLTPQKTGPAPPVRFGVNPDAKKLAPQPTGRRANLSQASKLFHFILFALGYNDMCTCGDLTRCRSSSKPVRVLDPGPGVALRRGMSCMRPCLFDAVLPPAFLLFYLYFSLPLLFPCRLKRAKWKCGNRIEKSNQCCTLSPSNKNEVTFSERASDA